MSDEKNEEAGKPQETELSEDQLEKAAGGAEFLISPKTSPTEKLQGEIQEQEIAKSDDPVLGDKGVLIGRQRRTDDVSCQMQC